VEGCIQRAQKIVVQTFVQEYKSLISSVNSAASNPYAQLAVAAVFAAEEDNYQPLTEVYEEQFGAGFEIELSGDLRFSQTTLSPNFSVDGLFQGATREEVVEGLRNGTISPSEIPVDFVERDGIKVVNNNRSASVLRQAGIPEDQWDLVNQTGNEEVEKSVDQKLQRNKLPETGTTKAVITRGSNN